MVFAVCFRTWGFAVSTGFLVQGRAPRLRPSSAVEGIASPRQSCQDVADASEVPQAFAGCLAHLAALGECTGVATGIPATVSGGLTPPEAPVPLHPCLFFLGPEMPRVCVSEAAPSGARAVEDCRA